MNISNSYNETDVESAKFSNINLLFSLYAKVIVEYEVEGQKYEITEGLAMESKTVKFGFLPIGQKKMPKINSKIGSIVDVNYNPDAPSEAYIVGNDGLA